MSINNERFLSVKDLDLSKVSFKTKRYSEDTNQTMITHIPTNFEFYNNDGNTKEFTGGRYIELNKDNKGNTVISGIYTEDQLKEKYRDIYDIDLQIPEKMREVAIRRLVIDSTIVSDKEIKIDNMNDANTIRGLKRLNISADKIHNASCSHLSRKDLNGYLKYAFDLAVAEKLNPDNKAKIKLLETKLAIAKRKDKIKSKIINPLLNLKNKSFNR